MKYFQYDNENGQVVLVDEAILLIREFSALLDQKRNINKVDKTGKNKEKAFKELKFIYLFYDGQSPYFQFPEQDRYNESLLDSGLTESELADPLFKEACKKYEQLENSSLEVRLLKAAMSAVESQIYYLEHVDLNERDPMTGKPIFKSKDLIAEIKGCKDIIVGLKDLELQVKKGESSDTKLRGDVQAGIFD